MSETVEKIVEALDALPEERQREVLDFVEALRKEIDVGTENGERHPQDDPILEALGSVDADLGSDRIDELLYGK